MILWGTSSQQLHITFILILPQSYHEYTTFQAKMENLNLMAKKIWPPLAPHRPSSSHCECNFWPMFCSIILRCTPFATTCIVHWGLRHHSFVVHWCVVAISRLMSTSFDDFHLVQNTLWNRRIPDRVTGYFCSNPVLMEIKNATCFIIPIYKILAQNEKCQQPEKC